MSARADILGRIRAAHAAAPPPDLGYADITRDYPRDVGRAPEDVVPTLVDRLVDYRAAVRECGLAELPQTVAMALTEAGVRSMVAPPGLPEGWLRAADVEVRRDAPPLTVDELGAVDGVLTACRVAVAETGTVVLDGADDQGRRVITLLPDYHLCVVFTGQVTADVPDALARLDPTRPLTMISGPSATSDIELNRVEGVHGPRRLEVIVVYEPFGEAPQS